MFKKVLLTGALVAAATFMLDTSEAQAGNCGYGGFNYGQRVSVGYRGVPVHTGFRGVSPYRGHFGVPVRGGFYGPAPIYRSGFRGGGFGVGPHHFGRGIPYGFGRSGISIGFGF